MSHLPHPSLSPCTPAPEEPPARSRVGLAVLLLAALLVLPFGLVVWTIRALVRGYRRRPPSPVASSPAPPAAPGGPAEAPPLAA